MRLLAIIITAFSVSNSVFGQTENASEKDSDLTHIEYVWNASGDKGNFRACIIGSEIKAETIESKEVVEVLTKLPSVADLIIVGSNEIKKAVSEHTELKVFVANKFYDQVVGRKGSAARWILIVNDGETISKYVSTHQVQDLITPRFERGKPQE
jgi:mannitol-specific phosphotransferase system IIBC component